MCLHKIKPQIPSAQKATDVVHYFGDPLHPNHAFHEVEPPKTVSGESIADFVQKCAARTARYNKGRNGRETIKGVGYWYIFAFAPGSFLTEKELRFFKETLTKYLAPDDCAVTSLHDHFFDGSCDWNFFAPSIVCGPEPRPRRSRYINEYLRIGHFIKGTLDTMNSARAAANMPLIPSPLRLQNHFVAACAKATKKLALPLVPASIPAIFTAIGIDGATWFIDAQGRIVFCKRRARSRALKIPVEKLLALIAAAIRSPGKPAPSLGSDSPPEKSPETPPKSDGSQPSV
jgi:hypothetical protein